MVKTKSKSYSKLKLYKNIKIRNLQSVTKIVSSPPSLFSFGCKLAADFWFSLLSMASSELTQH